jgi:hypothetical protein
MINGEKGMDQIEAKLATLSAALAHAVEVEKVCVNVY